MSVQYWKYWQTRVSSLKKEPSMIESLYGIIAKLATSSGRNLSSMLVGTGCSKRAELPPKEILTLNDLFASRTRLVQIWSQFTSLLSELLSKTYTMACTTIYFVPLANRNFFGRPVFNLQTEAVCVTFNLAGKAEKSLVAEERPSLRAFTRDTIVEFHCHKCNNHNFCWFYVVCGKDWNLLTHVSSTVSLALNHLHLLIIYQFYLVMRWRQQ